MQLVVKIPAEKIHDWASFHDVFKSTLGFPNFYGSNINAWINCMTSIDSADDGLSKITVAPGSILILHIEDAFRFRDRCPEQYDALVECCGFVNYRRVEVGESPVLALLLVGWARQVL